MDRVNHGEQVNEKDSTFKSCPALIFSGFNTGGNWRNALPLHSE